MGKIRNGNLAEWLGNSFTITNEWGQFNKETTSVDFFTTAECACKFSTYN